MSLQFARTRLGRTELSHRRVSYPWSLTQPFYLDSHPAGTATVMPQSSSGGLFQGDRLHQDIRVSEGAAARMEMQGATLAYARRVGNGSYSSWTISVDDQALFEFLGDPLVLTAGSSVAQDWTLHVAPTASLFFFDSWTWLQNQDLPDFNDFSNRLRIFRPNGELLALENTCVNAVRLARLQAMTAMPVRAFATALIILNPSLSPAASPIDRVSETISSLTGCWAGASTLPHDAGVVVRGVCRSASALSSLSETLWTLFRSYLTNAPPPRRRRGF